MATVAVRLLGTFEFVVGNSDTAQLAPGSRKARRLLRMLALARGRPVRVDQLVDSLWTEAPPARPNDQLSVLVSRLRLGLGRDRIQRSDHRYRLVCDWLDADELASVVDVLGGPARPGPDRAAQLARMVASLVRGPVAREDDDPEWILQSIADLDRLASRGLALAAESLIDVGDHLTAADLAAAVVSRDAYDEHATRLLMRAHAHAGRPASALATFAGLQERLRDDLGTDPDVETQFLHTAILRGELAVSESQRPDVTMVGREAQVAHLDELAERAGARPVRVAAVRGEAGIGKSTLLDAWADRRRARGDIVLIGRCGTLEKSVPLDAVLSAVADYLRAREDAEQLLGRDATILGPLLGTRPGQTGVELPTDAEPGQAVLFAALERVLVRISGAGRVLLLVDDAHRAGDALLLWLEYLQRRVLPLVVVVTARTGEGMPLPASDEVALGPLDLEATARLVGRDRAGDLFARSQGHPLFLTELAGSPGDDLPGSLVEHVLRRCDELGDAARPVCAAAVIGSPVDLELLAAVLHRPLLEVVDAAEMAITRGLFRDDAGRVSFRHELVRAALEAGTPGMRVTALHAEVARALATRVDADPMLIATHARLGGDTALAARCLREAALRAAERFDHATAESLLDDAVAIDHTARIDRARIRVLRRDYVGALDDVADPGLGVEGLIVGAWAAYFARDFETAKQWAVAGAELAEDKDQAARCAAVGGRVHHAIGDLPRAESLLLKASRAARGGDRAAASAWLGVLRAHQGRHGEALGLLAPAASGHVAVDDTSAFLHALLFSGLAQACTGRPAAALTAFDRYTAEVEQRQLPRFGGRGVNFSGWVLRSLGERTRGLEAHQDALESAEVEATRETLVAALQDMAEDVLEDHAATGADPTAASTLLDRAAAALGPDLVFGWRLELRQQLLATRRALALGDAETALANAHALAVRAVGVPRYRHTAALLEARARAALDEPVALDAVEDSLNGLDAVVAIEAWRWWGELGADLRQPAWVGRAGSAAAALQAGEYRDTLRRNVESRLDRWRALTAR